MTKEKVKIVVDALRKEGMKAPEILQELGSFLGVSQMTLNAMQKAGMTPEEILDELTSEGEKAPSVNVEPKGTRTDIAFVKRYLREVVGIPTHIKGYNYIATAVTMYKQDMPMTKELYPMVAKQYGTTASRVERAIRHAIETIWDIKFDLPEILGISVSPDKGKPANSQFITTIVAILEE